ncbi:Hypothetical predicted protein [Cloeon dipterum]|uniref:Uncharacterized protein n=1 Tax=Cloeon dipterum TaxID=197152 RepID=A0A8S1CDG5_9INSE|nr:Hypothetical predicted protein [Cloeon dipterum]
MAEKNKCSPLAALQKNERLKNYDETHRVYIAKVPPDVNEQGLINISEKLIGTVPLHSYKHQDEQASNDCETWAVMEYRSKREAEEFTLRTKQYLGIDAETGVKKNNLTRLLKDEDVPLESLALEDIISFNRQHKSEQKIEQEGKFPLQFCKYNASGVMVTTRGAEKYIPGPFVNGITGFNQSVGGLHRNSPLDGFQEYLRGYYDDFNDILFGLFRNTNSATTISNKFSLEEMHITSQSMVIKPKFPLVTDHNYRATNKFGELGVCWACRRVTAVCCSYCGKYFCSSSCFSKYSSHSSDCCNERQAAMESLWARNGVNLFNATSHLEARKDAAGDPHCPSWICQSPAVSGEWLSRITEDKTLKCTIEEIIFEFGEPIAFLLVPNIPQDSLSNTNFSSNDKDLKFVGSVFTSNIPEFQVWFKIIKVGSDIRLESMEFDDGTQSTIATLTFELRAVCKLKLEKWCPFDYTVLPSVFPSPPTVKNAEVTIAAICCSNMLYVKGTENTLQSAKFELDLNFAGSCAVPCDEIPPVGVCVLARSMNDNRFYRARITKKFSSNEVLVHLIDKGVKEVATVDKIFPLGEKFSRTPALCWLIKLRSIEEQPLTPKAIMFLQDMVNKRTKLALTKTPSGNVILEDAKTGFQVNDHLKSYLERSWNTPSPLDYSANDFFEGDTIPDFESVPHGKMIRLTVLSVNEPYVTCCNTESPLFNAITHSLVELSQTYVESVSKHCYVPKHTKDRICLAQREDNLWYRAYIISRREKSADLLFFDYSIHKLSVPYTKIRQLPAEFGLFPTLGMPLRLAGIFDDDQLQDFSLACRAKQLLQPGAIVKGVVLSGQDDTVLIVPQILWTLTDEGHMPSASLESVRKLLNTAPFKLCKEIAKSLDELVNVAEACDNFSDINHNASPVNIKMTGHLMRMVLFELVQEEVMTVAGTELQIARKAASHQLLRCFRMDYYWCLEEWCAENEQMFDKALDNTDLITTQNAPETDQPKPISLLDNIFVFSWTHLDKISTDMLGNERSSTSYKSSRSMKRSSDRDTPPLSNKRPRSIGRYDDSSDERVSPDRDRRRGRTPHESPPRSRYPDRDEYRSRTYSNYKVLCVSNLHNKASDEVIKDTLYREYKKYGDISVRISHDPDERVGYVCFRSYEDARDAKHAKPRIIIFDKAAIVEPVYDRSGGGGGGAGGGSGSAGGGGGSDYRRPRSLTPDYDRYYRQRSPGFVMDRSRANYDLGPPPMRSDFRRDPASHDYMSHPRHAPQPGPAHHYGGNHRGGPGMYSKGYDKHENKKDKFPNYLHHQLPEDDPLATRTLFAGNLEVSISDEELRRIFGRYGIVEDIDIKRPPPGTGNAYAFVRFQNLDMAHRSKVELSGQYIGKFQCKIGYGKVTPTTRIWVGGLGPWTSLPQLEREFDRFGAIKKIDYVKGDSCAYIQYDSMDAAQAAVKEMRGFPLGGPDRRLRIDFADVQGAAPAFPFNKSREFNYEAGYEGAWDEGNGFNYSGGSSRGYRGGTGSGGTGGDRSGGRGYRGRGSYRGYGQPGFEEEWAKGGPPEEGRRSHTPEPGEERSPRPTSRNRRSSRSLSPDARNGSGPLGSARTLAELARKGEVNWSGGLVLKNSLFPAKFHLTDGETDIVDILIKEQSGRNQLRITQRLRLDPPKLEDVSKRMATAGAHAVFLGLPASTSSITPEDANVQSRPMRNLVAYLKQKEAAGVISLTNKDNETTGVLYVFPPCKFSAELLKRTAPALSEEGLKEDHLVIVVLSRQSTAASAPTRNEAFSKISTEVIKLEPQKRERHGAGDLTIEVSIMRKYYRLILFIFLFISTIALLFYWHEYNRLRYVLEVLNFFGQPPEVSVTSDCLLNTSLFSTENVTIPDSITPVWHRLGNDLFVFSAFWEVVGKKEHVKVIGVARYAASLKLGCRLWYEGHEYSSEGRISHSVINMKVSHALDDPDKVNPYFILCSPEVTLDAPPYAVELYSEDQQPRRSPIILPVLFLDPSPEPSNNTTVVCVVPSSRRITPAEVAEFVSFHQILGVGQYIIYDDGLLTPTALDILKDKSLGYKASLLPWNFPFAAPEAASTALKWDCLLRSLSVRPVGVIQLQWNQLAVPRYHHTLSAMVRDFDARISTAQFVLTALHFCFEYPEEKSAVPFKALRRFYHADLKQAKEEPQLVLQRPSLVVQGLKTQQRISPGIIAIHTYMHCNEADNQATPPRKYDNSISKFKNELQDSRLLKLWSRHQG